MALNERQQVLFQNCNPGMLLRGDEAEVATGKRRIAFGPRYHPDNRHAAGSFHCLAQHLLMPAVTDLVEDDPRDLDFGIERLASEDKRSPGASHLCRIYHQEYRRVQELGKLSRAVRAARVKPVVNAAIPFDDIQSGRLGMTKERKASLFRSHEVGIEMPAGATEKPM